MLARTFARALLFWACTAGAHGADAATQRDGRQVRIQQGSLSAGLEQIARQTGAEILYDPRIVRGQRSVGVQGRMSAETALARLLSGTDIGYRRTAGGAFVLFVLPREALLADAEPIPEILVVGRRSQNADIRRTRNDIQPYYVSTRSDVENAHADNIGQFMRSRISADAQLVPPAQDTQIRPAVVRSEIDLRGLGSLRTLVLVDGRRMPSVPTPQVDFGQPDVNAIPASMIERIETLTGTAGGIYGPGAIGGVVNIILRRDYRGADLHIVSGMTDRGDARRLGIEARFGFTPDGGRTDVMIFAAHTFTSALRTGQRDYALRARQRQFANDPAAYIMRELVSNAVTVSSLQGDLTFDPQFGGGALGAAYTFLPTGFSGTDAERNALLTANAGSLVLALPQDASGAERYITSDPSVTSGLINVRHRFSQRFEAFAELLYLRNIGRFSGDGLRRAIVLEAGASTNPFQQRIAIQFPRPATSVGARTRFESLRFTTGLIAEIGSGWRATADLSLGRFRTGSESNSNTTGFAFDNAVMQGIPGPDGLPIDPLGDWNRFLSSSQLYLAAGYVESDQVNHFSIAGARLAGPVMRLPGGPLSATFLAERRREFVPATIASARLADIGLDVDIPLPRREQTITSGYAEFRLPLTAADAGLFLLRGLELQLAARYDGIATEVPLDTTPLRPSNDRITQVANGGVTFTAGGRIFPSRALMLRASIATGELPPTIEQLSTQIATLDDQFGPADPQRGGRPIGSEGAALLLQRGSNEIEAERATTLSAGFVLNPEGGRWPRLSIDYSRIDKRREVVFFETGLQSVLANESAYAGRVQRAPLADSDRALGFTAGRVLLIDARAFNSGRTVAQALHAQLDWNVPIGAAGGELRIYGNATWYLSLRKQREPGAPWVERVGYFDGPLASRGNLGLEWREGPLLIGLNAQYFGSHRATYTVDGAAFRNGQILAYQGALRIPPQAYLDLVVRRGFDLRGAGPLSRIDVNFGIQNLLDQRPPIVADTAQPGYSFYGDPRRRRFSLMLSGHF